MELVPKLNLNKHPKDNDNLSLVNALNIKLSADGSCITNEESIQENVLIKDFISNFFINNNKTYKNIISITPCNNELVIFANCIEEENHLYIFRYREANDNQTEDIYCCHGDSNLFFIRYSGGVIKTAFTYNVNSELVVAVAESGVENKDIPLKVINLGKYRDIDFEDKNSQDDQLSLSPAIKLAHIKNVEYKPGTAYKGWYYPFIRYQVNDSKYNYTQWYPLGQPIYVDTLEKQSIIKYGYNKNISFTGAKEILFGSNPSDGYGVGMTDYFSNESDIADETFRLEFYINDTKFKYYQLGFICASKSYTKAFKTLTYKAGEKYYGDGYKFIPAEYLFSANTIENASVDEFIIDNYNYYNVENIINFKNRLYISNYKEISSNNKIEQHIIDKINISLTKSEFTEDAVNYDIPVVNKNTVNSNTQYSSNKNNSVEFTDYFGISKDTIVKLESLDDYQTYSGKAFQFSIIIDGSNIGYGKIYYKYFDNNYNQSLFFF